MCAPLALDRAVGKKLARGSLNELGATRALAAVDFEQPARSKLRAVCTGRWRGRIGRAFRVDSSGAYWSIHRLTRSMDAFRLGVGHLGCVQRRNGIDNCHTNKKTGMASASAEIDDDGGNDDDDRTADPALLAFPPSPGRCVLDRRALAHWASQRGKVCAAAVVAGALNSLLAPDDDANRVAVETVLQEYQAAWRSQIEAVAAGIEGIEVPLEALLGSAAPCALPSSDAPAVNEALALLGRLVASYHRLSAPDWAQASTACVGIRQLMSALAHVGRARGLKHVDVNVLLDSEMLRASDRDGAWGRLWGAFGDEPGLSVLILHVPRHYALVFGLRERLALDGKTKVREVLTARKKQKPKEWVDFDQCIVPMMQGAEGSKCHFVLVRRGASNVM